MNVLIGEVIPENDKVCFGGVHYEIVRKDFIGSWYAEEEQFALLLKDANGNELTVVSPVNIRVDVVTH